MSHPSLKTFAFTHQEAWNDYHSDAQAFMQSKTLRELCKMARDRGITTAQLKACGDLKHKKTYLNAFQKTFMLQLICDMSAQQAEANSVVESSQNGMRVRNGQLIARNVELNRENTELRTKMQKIQSVNRALVRNSAMSSPEPEGSDTIRTLQRKLAETEALLKTANDDISLFGPRMVAYERKIMKSADGFARHMSSFEKTLEVERAKVKSIQKDMEVEKVKVKSIQKVLESERYGFAHRMSVFEKTLEVERTKVKSIQKDMDNERMAFGQSLTEHADEQIAERDATIEKLKNRLVHYSHNLGQLEKVMHDVFPSKKRQRRA